TLRSHITRPLAARLRVALTAARDCATSARMTTPAPPSEIAHALEQAVGFFRQRRLGEAEMVCARILQVSPDHFDTLNFLGVVRLQNGRFAEALAAFDRACALQPQSPSAHMNRGIALAELGRLSEALGEFDRALAV